MLPKITIAIDGYSACGKSTLARQLARKLAYTHIDSGAMYRGITLYLITNQIDFSDDAQLAAALQKISLTFIPSASGEQELWMNGENIEKQIREVFVAEKVSEVAMIAAVRTFAVRRQQEMGRQNGIVMDGRDVGTVVFPDAPLKLFMTAEVEVRIKRRWDEMKQKGIRTTYEQVKANLADRDYKDTHRAIGPLRQAPDAVVLDNTRLTEEEQLQFALDLVQKITGRR